MIVDTEVEITGNGKTLKHYRNKGYDIKVNQKTIVKISDLIETSTIKINCRCELCNRHNQIKYYNYIGNIKRNNIYRCNECSKSIRKENINYSSLLIKTMKNLKNILICNYGTTRKTRTK